MPPSLKVPAGSGGEPEEAASPREVGGMEPLHEAAGQGAERIALRSRAAQKWTTVAWDTVTYIAIDRAQLKPAKNRNRG